MRRYGRNAGDVYEMRKAGDSIFWHHETKLRGWKCWADIRSCWELCWRQGWWEGAEHE